MTLFEDSRFKISSTSIEKILGRFLWNFSVFALNSMLKRICVEKTKRLKNRRSNLSVDNNREESV